MVFKQLKTDIYVIGKNSGGIIRIFIGGVNRSLIEEREPRVAPKERPDSRHNGVTGYHRVLSWVIAEVTGTEATEPHTGGTGREK
jgi:hypothetical protein